MTTGIADNLARALRDGLTHPGNPDTGQPAVGLPLPFRAVGMPPEMADHVTATTKLLAEAIIYEIEKTHAIIDRDTYEDLRTAVQPLDTDPGMVTVHCRCDRTHIQPLLHLAVRDGRAIIDAPQALTGLAKRNPHCPSHEIR